MGGGFWMLGKLMGFGVWTSVFPGKLAPTGAVLSFSGGGVAAENAAEDRSCGYTLRLID